MKGMGWNGAFQHVVSNPVALAPSENLFVMHILGLTPDPQSQKLWEWGPAIYV